MKKLKRLFRMLLLVVIVCVVVVVGAFALPSSTTGPVADVAEDVKTAVANTALDVSGIKDKVKSALEENKSVIASATGLTESQVDAAIEDLDIDSWQVASLPADAQATGTTSGTYSGMSATITTYEDPGYVTVETGGQSITLSVPESAQEYVSLLGYL